MMNRHYFNVAKNLGDYKFLFNKNFSIFLVIKILILITMVLTIIAIYER